jgi:hypothetical protein
VLKIRNIFKRTRAKTELSGHPLQESYGGA